MSELSPETRDAFAAELAQLMQRWRVPFFLVIADDNAGRIFTTDTDKQKAVIRARLYARSLEDEFYAAYSKPKIRRPTPPNDPSFG